PLLTSRNPEIVESVVVATHAGMPFTSAKTWPFAPAVVVASAPDPFPYVTAPEATAAHPVPPFPTGNTPVTSDARLTRAVETAPATALRNPVTFPSVNELDTTRFEDEAVPLTA